ncbi:MULTISPECIES: serine/threonine protein kinase [unclassified Legionella]|uniref:serine/threonine protein kinase n=1 Tax=unclassified Legionella TaxID=2622702 RepID=UPI0010567DCA|nr:MULTISPECIES: serine/threonine protein kinase [unclassified Legionella]MDI9818038.1 serine/threonine protein kinase [Legionella sp. PL877]
MGNKETDNESSSYILFPVKQKDRQPIYYVSDYSEALADSVYKGYRCELRNNQTILTPSQVKKEEVHIDSTKPVAIKFYEKGKHPSPYQFYDSEIAILNLAGQKVLIMDFIDGFHIHPDAKDNPQLRQLTFSQAVNIAWQLIIELNRRHYNNSNGPAVVHGDIKGTNLKIRMSPTGEKCKIDIFYLDGDYAKPITNRSQCAQGTLEHLAIELLDGHYSESSDFFALSPILLSLFGARNPLQEIIAFRNAHPDMDNAQLVKKYRDLGFCSEGLFEHFAKKPEPFICNLIKEFILQMGAKYKEDRPAPAAILEFFTALRQLSLIDESAKDNEFYLLRLQVAVQNENWLTEQKYINLFLRADLALQERLMALMHRNQRLHLYTIVLDNPAASSLVNRLRKSIASDLRELTDTFQPPSLLSSLFSSPVTKKELEWLLNCYEQNNKEAFYSPTNEKMRLKLMSCKEKNTAPLILAVTAEFTHSAQLAHYKLKQIS